MSDKCYVENDTFYVNYRSVDAIPLEDYAELHREYWKANAESHKFKLPIVSAITGDCLFIMNKCFACEYARRITWQRGDCSPRLCLFCPVKEWREVAANVINPCATRVLETGRPYLEYCRTNDPQRALEIAAMEWDGS